MRDSRCDGEGHGEQSLAPRHDFRTSEHYLRREDYHFERCYHPRRLEARWSWTRRGHLFGALLSRGGGMCHEVGLEPSYSFFQRNLISSHLIVSRPGLLTRPIVARSTIIR